MSETTPRTLPAIQTSKTQIKTANPFSRNLTMSSDDDLNKEHIYNCFLAYDHLNLIWDKCFTHQDKSQHFSCKKYTVSIVVPTIVAVHSTLELNDKRPLTISDESFSKNSECHIDCNKQTFGNWKIEVYAAKQDIMEILYVIMMQQLKNRDYITLEICKETCHKLSDIDILDKRDILLIPTGYNGYLVNVTILQENIYSLITELILIYNEPNNILGIKRQSILQSIEDLNFPHSATISVLKPMQSTTKLIQLNKLQVSFLLGKKGKNLEAIRNKSGCKIVIMPISPNQTVLLGNKRIIQFIKLFGTPDKVDNAHRMIMSNLNRLQ